MDILLVSDVYLPTVSGVASSTDSIAHFMVNDGHHVDLVCPKPLVPFDPPHLKGLTIWYTPGLSDSLFVNKSYTPFPMGFGILWNLLRSKKYDVIHVQEPGSLGITALLLAKIFHIPIVGARHFSWLQIERVAPPLLRPFSVPFIQAYVWIIYHLFDLIMVPTKTAGKELSELIGRDDKIIAVSNGVETDEYLPRTRAVDELRTSFNVPKKIPVFLYIGRLDRDKNVETFFRAASKLLFSYHLVIVGVGREKESLIELANTLKISPHITWIEETNKKKIIALYQLADVFVIMSPVETQSIVALQAISCGLPLVAANAGALPELVNGKNGYLIPTYDAGTLAEVLTRLASNEKLRATMGKESRALSLTHHKPLVLKQLETLYLSLTQKK